MPPRKSKKKDAEAPRGQASSSQGPLATGPPPGMARESEDRGWTQEKVAEQAGQPVGTGAEVAAEAPAREARERAGESGDEEKRK